MTSFGAAVAVVVLSGAIVVWEVDNAFNRPLEAHFDINVFPPPKEALEHLTVITILPDGHLLDDRQTTVDDIDAFLAANRTSFTGEGQGRLGVAVDPNATYQQVINILDLACGKHGIGSWRLHLKMVRGVGTEND